MTVSPAGCPVPNSLFHEGYIWELFSGRKEPRFNIKYRFANSQKQLVLSSSDDWLGSKSSPVTPDLSCCKPLLKSCLLLDGCGTSAADLRCYAVLWSFATPPRGFRALLQESGSLQTARGRPPLERGAQLHGFGQKGRQHHRNQGDQKSLKAFFINCIYGT